MNARNALPWIASAAVHFGLLMIPVGLREQPPRLPLIVDVTLSASRGSLRAARPFTIPVPARQAGGVEAGSRDSVPSFRTSPTLTGSSSTFGSEGPSVDGTRDPQPQADSTSAGPAGSSGTAIGWEGAPRTLLRRKDPRFPAVLSVTGQEVEGEARITVAPSGAVTRVEITRSTGYIEIDASVEEALRGYLFSRVDGGGDARGTVTFRFRLEKTD